MSRRVLFQSSSVAGGLTQAFNDVHNGLSVLVEASGVDITEYEVNHHIQRPFSEGLLEVVCTVIARDKRGLAVFALRTKGALAEGKPTTLECVSHIYAEGLRSPEGTDVLAHAWMILLNELDPLAIRINEKERGIFDVVDTHMFVKYD